MIILPALPDMIIPLQATQENIGLLLSYYTLPGVFLTPIMGAFIDRIGAKRMLILSLGLYAIAGFTSIFAETFSILLFWRIIQGIGAVSLLPIAMIIVGNKYGGTRRSGAMGALLGMYNLMAALFPIMGGFLAEISWKAPFLVYLLAIPLAIMAAKMVPSGPKVPDATSPTNNSSVSNTEEEGIITQVRKYVLNSAFLYPALLAAFSFFIIIGITNTYVPLYLANELGIGVSMRGIITSIRFATAGVSATAMGYIIGRYNNALLFALTYCFTAGGFFFIVASYGSLISLLPIFLCGLGHGMIVPISHSLVYDRTSKSNQGFIISIYQALLRVAQAAGPFGFGIILGLTSLYNLFVLGTILSSVVIIGLIIQYVVYPRFSAVVSNDSSEPIENNVQSITQTD